MTKRPLLQLFEEAFAFAGADPSLTSFEREQADARADFFKPLAIRIRRNDIEDLEHSKVAACMLLGFLLMKVEEENLEARLEELAQMIVNERTMLIDMETFAEGEPDEEPE